jgi:hypothetical protein
MGSLSYAVRLDPWRFRGSESRWREGRKRARLAARHAHLVCEPGNRLADVAVVVNDLADGEAEPQQIAAVAGCARPHLGQRALRMRRFLQQRLDELIEEAPAIS